MRDAERWFAGALFTVALLTFFFPLASLQLPIVGSIEVSGYDVLSKAQQLEERFGNLNNQTPQRSAEAPSAAAAPNTPSASLPFSIQAAPALPFEILGAFGFSAMALLLCVIGASRGSAKVCSSLAGALGILSILHIAIADSDLHTWFQSQMQPDADSGNPFSALAQRIGTLIANTVHFQPGPGLYTLAASASLGALLLNSGFLSNRSDEPEIEEEARGNHTTVVAVMVVAVAAVGISALMISRQSPNEAIGKPAPTSTAPAQQIAPPPTSEGLSPGSADETDTKSQVIAALNDLSTRQGHNHLYTACGDDAACITDSDAPNDGFKESFTANPVAHRKLYEVGFRNLRITNGSEVWEWNIVPDGYSPIEESQPASGTDSAQ